MKARNFIWVFIPPPHMFSLLGFPHTSLCFSFFLSSAFFHLPGLNSLDKLTPIRCVLASVSQTDVQGIEGHLWYSTPRGNIHKGSLVFWDKCLFLPEILPFPIGLVRCPLLYVLRGVMVNTSCSKSHVFKLHWNQRSLEWPKLWCAAVCFALQYPESTGPAMKF